VRGMTEAMGGTVMAMESRLGGLRIEVDLPEAAAVPSDAAPSGAAPPSVDSTPAPAAVEAAANASRTIAR